MEKAIKCTCAVCCKPMCDETGGRDVPLCSEECELEYAKPSPERRIEPMLDNYDERFGCDADNGF